MTGPDWEVRVRREAIAWLTVRTNDGQDAITSEALSEFTIDGEPFRLMDPQRGIRKPRQFGAAALSMRTVYTRPSGIPPYDDTLGEDGLLRYKWRGEDALHPDNRALRAAMAEQTPLIWFFGVGTALYLPVFPVFVVAEQPAAHEFSVIHEESLSRLRLGSPVEEVARKYILRETKQRIHQPVFRAMIIRAYAERCAVCSIHHPDLLDAAHIMPDSDERGVAAVSNGLAMCKIHHAAYDRRILGIRPDLIVEIRRDILGEVDGPMLRYGLQERHLERLMQIPRRREERPNTELLRLSYQQFRDAG